MYHGLGTMARVLRRHSTLLALPSACAEALRPPALRAGPPDPVSPSSKRRHAAPARTTSRCTCSAPCPSGYSTARSCSRRTRHAPVPYAGALGLRSRRQAAARPQTRRAFAGALVDPMRSDRVFVRSRRGGSLRRSAPRPRSGAFIAYRLSPPVSSFVGSAPRLMPRLTPRLPIARVVV